MILESKIKEKVKKMLAKYKYVSWFMPQAGIYGKSGVADFVCCVKSFYLEIETKAPGKKQTPLQKKRERDIHTAGGSYLLVDDEKSLSRLDRVLALNTDKNETNNL